MKHIALGLMTVLALSASAFAGEEIPDFSAFPPFGTSNPATCQQENGSEGVTKCDQTLNARPYTESVYNVVFPTYWEAYAHCDVAINGDWVQSSYGLKDGKIVFLGYICSEGGHQGNG